MAFIRSMAFALAAVVASATVAQAAQSTIGATELADYRLTARTLDRFTRASGLLMAITRTDPRYKLAPLFTREVIVSGDAVVMARGLVARLENDPALVSALEATGLAPREYATFAVALFGARLAQGFVKAGVIKVRAGVPADNVDFVAQHEAEVTTVLAEIGITD
jgi:hypothetical protein